MMVELCQVKHAWLCCAKLAVCLVVADDPP